MISILCSVSGKRKPAIGGDFVYSFSQWLRNKQLSVNNLSLKII